MTRLTMALVASLVFFSTASGMLSRPKDQPPNYVKTLNKDRKLNAPKPAPTSANVVLTEQTEIKLDGRACKLAEVPGNAEIVLIDLAADKKTVLRIHFRLKE